MNKWMDRWKKKIDTTCLELNLNLWTEPATDKKFTHRCEFAVNSARHWAHFDMNKKQSSLRPPMSCVLLVYAVYFSLLIFRIIFIKKTTFVSTSWIVVNVLREAWQDLRPKLCESSNEARVALGSEEKFAYVTRFNATCFERQLETLVRTERILYISHWFLLLFHWIFS